MIQTFDIPGRLDGLNEYVKACRSNARYGGRVKRQNQDIVCYAINAARLKPMNGKVHVSICWVEPNMRRDKDNISSGKKYILDALVELGIIKNDGWKEIDGFTETFKVNKSNPHITVTLKNISDLD